MLQNALWTCRAHTHTHIYIYQIIIAPKVYKGIFPRTSPVSRAGKERRRQPSHSSRGDDSIRWKNLAMDFLAALVAEEPTAGMNGPRFDWITGLHFKPNDRTKSNYNNHHWSCPFFLLVLLSLLWPYMPLKPKLFQTKIMQTQAMESLPSS